MNWSNQNSLLSFKFLSYIFSDGLVFSLSFTNNIFENFMPTIKVCGDVRHLEKNENRIEEIFIILQLGNFSVPEPVYRAENETLKKILNIYIFSMQEVNHLIHDVYYMYTFHLDVI